MEILFLGTSAGTPTRQRNMSGLALRLRGARQWVLVDCAEGTQHRVLRTPLSLMSLRAVFITHLHGDHCYGLPGLLASAGMLGRSEPLTIVGPPPLRAMIEAIMAASELTLPYPLTFLTPHELEDPALLQDSLPDLAVEATALSHRIPCWAYGFTESALERRLDTDKLRADAIPSSALWGELQRGRDVTLEDGRRIAAHDYLLAPRRARRIVVAGDNDRPELLATAAHGADVLVHEATYTEEVLLKVGPGPQHSSALRVARFAQGAGVRNLVLTHFSPRYQDGGPLPLSLLEDEARAEFDGQLVLARDLDHYVLDRTGELRQAV
ncbi:ribonuclease Z [Massilia sp. YIM B02443]|uniref:ribonuclease Z n=1 Tax=Massilia sp. YIM B02443 TaxID=3050127 RepID=UPI0025B700AA|nr:ribonuclease Z [Massilia sp. YIM B02443]MDN4035453.1 ribonuclease Z [Massilia sp. YIM B02443]